VQESVLLTVWHVPVGCCCIPEGIVPLPAGPADIMPFEPGGCIPCGLPVLPLPKETVQESPADLPAQASIAACSISGELVRLPKPLPESFVAWVQDSPGWLLAATEGEGDA